MNNEKCEARHQGGNEMCCTRCGLLWDADDPEPPECLTDAQVSRQVGCTAIKMMKELLNEKN